MGFTFYLDELRVFFPYDAVYPEQYEYMKELKNCLDAPGHGILEMPTGTGKTVALFSLITSYQLLYANKVGKLIFCTRTIPEMNKALLELRTILDFRDEVLEREFEEKREKNLVPPDAEFKSEKVLGVGLSARRNMCVHHEISTDPDRDRVDARCRRMISPFIFQRLGGVTEAISCKCKHYEKYQRVIDNGEMFVKPDVYTIDELTELGKKEVADIEDLFGSRSKNSSSSARTVANRVTALSRAKELRQKFGGSGNSGAQGASSFSIPEADLNFTPVPGSVNSASSFNSGMSSLVSPVMQGGVAIQPQMGTTTGGGSSSSSSSGTSSSSQPPTGAAVPSALSLLHQQQSQPQQISKGGWCPYYTARKLLQQAKIVVLNYQYVLDPKVSQVSTLGGVGERIGYKMAAAASSNANNQSGGNSKEPSIVVFDEAHNIDDICSEALSVELNEAKLKGAEVNIQTLKNEINRVKNEDANRLQEEYQRLVQNLQSAGRLNEDIADRLQSPVIPEDIREEAVPGNIRKGEQFLRILEQLVQFFKSYLNVDRASSDQPLSLLQKIHDRLDIDGRTLKFFYERLKSLLNTLNINDFEKFNPISKLCDFSTLLGTYSQGFVILIDPYPENEAIKDPKLLLYCVDSSLAMRPVLKRYQSVVLTSGTISPLHMYVDLLGMQENMIVTRSFQMTMERQCICPLIVTRGPDQVPVSSNFEARDNLAVTRNYGELLLSLAKTVADGIVCFFTSYRYMELVVERWYESGLLGKLMDQKLVFLETKDVVATTQALNLYRQACDSGRGAVFLSIARGKVAEGIDFDRHYGRCVVLFGVPFQYTLSYELRAKLHYLHEHYDIQESEFLNFDAMRHASQCVGRVLRSKKDYGIMCFADHRYGKAGKREKIPEWIRSCLDLDRMNLSTDSAVFEARKFLLNMSQPYDSAANKNLLRPEDLVTEPPPGTNGGGSVGSGTGNNEVTSTAPILAEKQQIDIEPAGKRQKAL
ncbi:unnamed protein product [Amoebophrya sp. A120]|nr:unnamed protein product [Amoebophrya sp. A120]|eukprot:GSA120T00019274001.1